MNNWKKTGRAGDMILFPVCAFSNGSTPFQNHHLDSSKLKEFADNNFKFEENDRKFSTWVENAVGKGEIARHEQFLFFPQCFQKTCTADT